MALDKAFFDKTYPWAGIKTETIDGQEMVFIPKFYYKTGVAPVGSQQAGKKCWWVVDRPIAGYRIHPAFMKDGAEIPGFWVGAYECSVDAGASSKAASVSGKSPLVSIDFPTMQNRCTARNVSGQTGWHLWNIYELAATQMLCLIELGSPDVQAKIGSGNSNSSAAVATGSTNAKWRGISELWGNVWHMVDGLKGSGTTIQILDRLGNGTYINTGVAALSAAHGYPKEMMDTSGSGFDFNDIFVPKSIDQTASNGTFGDYYWYAVSDFVCYHGGYWGYGAYDGLFCLNLNGPASYSNVTLGGRLAKV
ncbi:hypothetical protein [Propionispora vibrioides]|uniref:Uncharacterized protein n=1 Tax=Propionispora vibrioides TaxID=112903 RepID=A0A1H8U7M6_9FIRM|nr:hypothetical protein [Propionispora vibrioides]SEO98834.1 hypothetical protein SAMN04490178_10854 [Propionispora vibrioides]